jgi:hypothetical protein
MGDDLVSVGGTPDWVERGDVALAARRLGRAGGSKTLRHESALLPYAQCQRQSLALGDREIYSDECVHRVRSTARSAYELSLRPPAMHFSLPRRRASLTSSSR